ncbi:MAG: putative toxin-antitoxin system toxin component, PIN family [Candidatus Binatia bacterium]
MQLVALLDSNVWVSAFVKPSGPPGHVVAAWRRDKFSAVTSSSQLIEIAEVLMRPRLMRRFKYTPGEAETLVRLIAARATVVETVGALQICRDPDDDEILEAAIQGKAQYLVTRDDDLKRDLDLIKMARGNRVRVVSVRQFLRRLSRLAPR